MTKTDMLKRVLIFNSKNYNRARCWLVYIKDYSACIRDDFELLSKLHQSVWFPLSVSPTLEQSLLAVFALTTIAGGSASSVLGLYRGLQSTVFSQSWIIY